MAQPRIKEFNQYSRTTQWRLRKALDSNESSSSESEDE